MKIEDFIDSWYPHGSEARRNWDQQVSLSDRTNRFLDIVFGWLQRIPIVGRLAYVFWTSLFEHDMDHTTPRLRLRNTLDPRGGAITFAYLNDGMSPSLWHTWQQLRHSDDAGIYPMRAPRSAAEAEWVHRNHEFLPKGRVDR